ncbi:MAG TPA: branched-chain amino acid ABC transporter permease, partial [Acidimicrobiia bacterium]|nr:branched-chain amino acid ABC transporter permease [Acidimicrobiia bacterium]
FVLFPFGDRGTIAPSSLDRIADLAGSGLRFGLIIAVAAVGLSLVYGTTGLINFAHGELLAFGAIVAWYLNSPSDGLGLTLVVAGVLAVIAGGAFGAGLEVGLWRPLRKRRTGNVAMLVVSIGLALFLRSTFQVVFGPTPRSYSQYAVQSSWEIGPLDILPKSIATIVISVAILVVVALLLLRTRLGTAVRAVTDNSDLAESSGIDVQRVILAVWITCGALAAAAGVLLGMTQTVEYDMGFKVLLVIFAAMILGGLGSAFGAMVGGALLGLVLEIGSFWIPTDFKNAVALGMLIIVLLFRPQGILGVRERVG